MEVLEPRPLDGGCRWTASPAANTRCFCRWVAYISLLPHRLVPVISMSRSGMPRRFLAISMAFSVSTSGGGWLMS